MRPTYPRYRWVILAVVVGAQFAVSAFYLGWGALTPFLRADFGLTREQVGLIVGATAAGAAVAAAPLGQITDRVGARRAVMGTLIAMGLLAVLATFSPSFPLLFAGVFAAGCAYGAINPTTVKLLVPWFPRRELGTAVGLKQMGNPVAGALTAATLPALTLALGSWRPPVAALGGVMGFVALAAALLIRERPVEHQPTRRSGVRWWVPLLRRNVALLCAISVLYAAVQGAWLGHLVLYAQEGLGLPITVGAGLLALTQVGSIAGRLSLGILSDRLFDGRRRGLLIVCGLAATILCGTLPLLGAAPLWLLGPIGIAFGFTGSGWPSLQIAAFADEGGAQSSGALAGLGTTFGSLGVAIGPPLFGRTVDVLGTYTPAWEGLAILALLGVLCSVAIREQPAGSTQRAVSSGP